MIWPVRSPKWTFVAVVAVPAGAANIGDAAAAAVVAVATDHSGFG